MAGRNRSREAQALALMQAEPPRLLGRLIRSGVAEMFAVDVSAADQNQATTAEADLESGGIGLINSGSGIGHGPSLRLWPSRILHES
jgi:hypothetical protein